MASPSGNSTLVSAAVLLGVLTAITGAVSWEHAHGIVLATGSTGLVSDLVPFVPDLMIATGSLALLDAAPDGGRPVTAWASVVTGIGATLAMNILSGLHGGPGGAMVAALPPVAFILSLETLLGIVRRRRAAGPAAEAAGEVPAGHEAALRAAAAWQAEHGRTITRDALRQALGVSTSKATELLRAVRPALTQETS
jgi:hypothetical protein